MIITVLIALLILLILFSGCFSASETALFSLSSLKVKVFKNDVDPKKRLIAELLSKPRDLLVTIIMLNVLVNILVQNVVSSIFGDYSSVFLNVGIPLCLTLVFGEVIPKSIGLANNAKVAVTVAPYIKIAQNILLPFRRVLISFTSIISRSLFFFLKKEEDISFDELQYALKASKQYGVLNEDEADLISGYLQLQEATIKEVMRPRDEMIYFTTGEPLSKLIHLFVDQECSRIPICNETLDNVVGLMTSRLFFLHREELKDSKDLLSIVQKPFFIPESINAYAVMRQMYDKKESIALVVDEYGSISGLITLEDLVEMVVGEIADRRDRKSRYTKAGEDVIIASGKLELSDLEDIFGIHLVSKEHMITINGWLIEQIGDIPKSGFKYETRDFLFHVLAADPNRIRRLYIRRLKSPTSRKKGGG